MAKINPTDEPKTEPVAPPEETAPAEVVISQWEFIKIPPTREDVMRLLSTLRPVWGVDTSDYADYVQALPQKKKVSRPHPTNPNLTVEDRVEAWTLYMSVGGRIKMIEAAADQNGWQVDFLPEMLDNGKESGRIVYRETVRIRLWTEGKKDALLGRKSGTAWVPYSGGSQAAGSNPYEKCVHPATAVLTDDLRWVKAGDLAVGDTLFAFDEETSTRGVGQRFRRAVVESHRISEKPSVTVRAGGTHITCSADHQFLVSQRETWRRWVAAKDLLPGDRIVSVGPTWTAPETRDAGWLAGFLDGEGHIGNGILRFTQVKGPVLEEACRILDEHGIPYTLNVEDRSGVGLKDVVRGHVTGGHLMSTRALGMFRPVRLNAEATWLDKSFGKSLRVAVVESVEDAGVQPVVVMQTSTRTFIAEGMLSHNCETSARGRALAAWGFGVFPGSGIASVEEMQAISANAHGMQAEQIQQGGRGSRPRGTHRPSRDDLMGRLLTTMEEFRQRRGVDEATMTSEMVDYLAGLGVQQPANEDGSINWANVHDGQLQLAANKLGEHVKELAAREWTGG